MNRKVFIIIPAYNEATIIEAVLDEIRREGYKNIIVIDDGSSDDTGSRVRKQAIVLKHFLNRGKGAAIRTGMEAAKKMDAQAVVTMDGDGQHNPRNIAAMIKKLNKGYDVVLGSRLLNRKDMPLVKICANYLGNIFTWLMYGIYVSDSQSGFRAYSKKALQLVDTKTDHYEYDSEIIREIAKQSLSNKIINL